MVTIKKFSARFCTPCRSLTSLIKEVQENYKTNINVSFLEYDVKDYSEEAEKYQVRSVPTLIIEKDGIILSRFTGLLPKTTYTNAINEAIN